jgi:hypothetical protein
MADHLKSVVIGEIVAKALQDKELKKALLADPAQVLGKGGVQIGNIQYKVVEDTASLKNTILPFEPLSNAMKLDVLPEGASPQQIARYIITKSQADEKYKKQVLSDIDTVLQDLGVTLPPGISITILADTATLQHIVIPYLPPASGELSDDQLEAVAGGKHHHHHHDVVKTHTNVATEAEAAVDVVAAVGAAAVSVVVLT